MESQRTRNTLFSNLVSDSIPTYIFTSETYGVRNDTGNKKENLEGTLL